LQRVAARCANCIPVRLERSKSESPRKCRMFEIGVTIAVIVIAAVALRRWLFGREPPAIDGGAVSRNWLDEHRLAKRDSRWP